MGLDMSIKGAIFYRVDGMKFMRKNIGPKAIDSAELHTCED